MAGVFERLQQEIESKQRAGGITVLDLTQLSPQLRRIMRLLLREAPTNITRLCMAMDELPAEERLSYDDLCSAMEVLTGQSWLIQIGTGKQAIYKVNLRRRPGSTLSLGVWGRLDSKLKNKPDKK